MMPAPYRLIDLFAGAGGLSLGFANVQTPDGLSAFEPVWANDFNEYAAATYNANFGDHCVHGDIVDLLEDPTVTLPLADVVAGGPPCQGFSLLNKNREADPRKQLWRPFMEVVKRSGARVFIMENVRQLLTSSEIEEIREEAARMGFLTVPTLLCAADYGVPQERYRAFILGVLGPETEKLPFPPPKTHRNPSPRSPRSLFSSDHDLPEWVTVKDAIGDLPEPVGTEISDDPPPLNLHFGRTPTAVSLKRYQLVPPGGNRFDLQANAPELTPKCWINKPSGGTDLFGRLWWDRPSVTIRTEFFKPEKGRYLHPEQHRPITHREAARLQSFPDSFKFAGSKIEIARQIGNAVPPRLAYAVGGAAYQVLCMMEAQAGRQSARAA